jgi:general secretion pathway protein G
VDHRNTEPSGETFNEVNMSSNRRSFRRGFTLVEILIVVIILGILAAIVVPQFTNASQSARVSSVQSLLQTLRSQIQLYKLQHGDTLPNLVTDWTPLTQPSTYSSQSYGPYMQAVPSNPLNSLSGVSDASANLSTLTTLSALNGAIKSPGATIGFVYDYSAGGTAGSGSGLIYATADATGTTIANNGTTAY